MRAHVPDFGPYAKEDWPPQDKGQAAMITRLDSYVGRLLGQLRLLGLAENTLVIFSSDNGPHNESNHDLNRFHPSGPFSGIKRSLTEGGIRVPAIAWWPGHIKPRSETDHVAYFGDWMATAAELAGAHVPPGCDSLSFVPTLLGRSSDQQHEFLYWEFHDARLQPGRPVPGALEGNPRRSVSAPLALYDLKDDVAEKTNVAAEHPEIAAKIDAYLKSARSESLDWPAK